MCMFTHKICVNVQYPPPNVGLPPPPFPIRLTFGLTKRRKKRALTSRSRGNGANGFLEVVARRDAATLIPLIQKWILPGTIIYHVHLRCPLIKEKKALTSSVTFKFLI